MLLELFCDTCWSLFWNTTFASFSFIQSRAPQPPHAKHVKHAFLSSMLSLLLYLISPLSFLLPHRSHLSVLSPFSSLRPLLSPRSSLLSSLSFPSPLTFSIYLESAGFYNFKALPCFVYSASLQPRKDAWSYCKVTWYGRLAKDCRVLGLLPLIFKFTCLFVC